MESALPKLVSFIHKTNSRVLLCIYRFSTFIEEKEKNTFPHDEATINFVIVQSLSMLNTAMLHIAGNW